ncbi:MAG TPA: HAD family phosphatase [Candidatus Angelobacter sp.]|jgi:beta-phosphoglucomutase
MQTLASVIFDFDGVIADSHPAHLRAWKDLFRSLGKDVSDAELSFVLEGAKREEILQRFLGELTFEQLRVYGDEKQHLFQSLASEIKLIDGFADFLAEVDTTGLPMAVATSGNRERVESMLKSFGLRSRFCTIVTGEDVKRGKPDPALFQLAARGLQVEPERILVCEDAVSGVHAAKAAGMKCLAIAANGRRAKLKEAGANLVVENFTQVRLNDVKRIFSTLH